MLLREPWRTRLLFVSVAGNLFAAALFGAHFAMRLRHQAEPPRAEILMDRMARALPAEDADRFRQVMRLRLPEIEDARARVEQARAAMFHVLAQTPYDQEAVRRAMKAWQTAWVAMSDDLGDSMLGAVSGLSSDGRRRLAEAGMRHRP
jgi:uncharacterized membrane protein